jgi:flavin reductase (DIM6/NTAB) family NADH-FMN oxidoreductase RutF
MRIGLESMAFDEGYGRPVGPAAAGFVGAEQFRQAFRALASGVAVISFDVGGEVHGFTATSLTSVSKEPPLALFCVGNGTASRSHIERGQIVGISLLGINQAEIARAFASRTPEGGYVDIGVVHLDGAPTIQRSIATMVAEITEMHPAGDHTVCICALRAVRTAADSAPLIYFARDYHAHRPLVEEVRITRS